MSKAIYIEKVLRMLAGFDFSGLVSIRGRARGERTGDRDMEACRAKAQAGFSLLGVYAMI